jgi:uncharacterized membrane protein
MVYGICYMVYGICYMVYAICYMVYGTWYIVMLYGICYMVQWGEINIRTLEKSYFNVCKYTNLTGKVI